MIRQSNFTSGSDRSSGTLQAAWEERRRRDPRAAGIPDEAFRNCSSALVAALPKPSEPGGLDAAREAAAALGRVWCAHGASPAEVVAEFRMLADALAACDGGTGGPATGLLALAESALDAWCEHDAALRGRGERLTRNFAEALEHELNTPLGAAETAALMLESDDVVTGAQERRRFAGLIQRNLRRARAVLADVRELALGDGDGAARGPAMPVAQVLAEVIAEVRDVAREAGVRIEIVEPVPAMEVNGARAELILLNLLGNAIKYADPTREPRWVRIRFEPRDDHGGCWVAIEDNGIGISGDDQHRLFRRHFRAKPEHADGKGLGLAIVREAVLQMGGRIDLRSEPGVGTTFRVLLPPHGPEQDGKRLSSMASALP